MTKKAEQKTDPRTKIKYHWSHGLVKWLWLGVVVMVVFEALIANGQAASGRQLADLQDKQDGLSTQVDQLERQVAANGSLQKIRQQAIDQFGMQPVDKNVLYLPLLSPTPTGVAP